VKAKDFYMRASVSAENVALEVFFQPVFKWLKSLSESLPAIFFSPILTNFLSIPAQLT